MLHDVIAAPATPAGRSALHVIRVSGRGAFEVAARVIHPFSTAKPRTLQLAEIRDARNHLLDRATYVAFQGPNSYTGEDLVEVTTHGGLVVPVQVLEAFFKAGARLAERGEFTRRALLNGKMDLLQAEAVADLIDSTAPLQARAALNQLDRNLSCRIESLRNDILELEALISYEIDFPEEDSPPVAEERIREAIGGVKDTVLKLLETSQDGELLREGATVVIAGKPNAGKSSLFNALLGHERAIVTEMPGTTRDAIEAPASCCGYPVRLIDTAGLRDSRDPVERIGIEVSRKYLAAADVILFCTEAGSPMNEEERAFLEEFEDRSIVVATKCDLQTGGSGRDGRLRVSAVTGEGLERLREVLAGRAFKHLAGTDLQPMLTRARHRVSLEESLAEIEEFSAARMRGVESSVSATHLQSAVLALEELIGTVTPDDVLARIFERFCVGK